MNAGVPADRHADLDEMARRVIDANLYMTLGTQDPDGSPRLSPVFYTAARYTDFYWLSSPQAQHSRNLAERPELQIVIFDSTADVGRGEAVYVTATARQVEAHEVDAVCPEAFRTVAGALQVLIREIWQSTGAPPAGPPGPAAPPGPVLPAASAGSAAPTAPAVRRAGEFMGGPRPRSPPRPRPRGGHPPAPRPGFSLSGACRCLPHADPHGGGHQRRARRQDAR
jgi:nitroimidazol reductase NimA-like FMN-containing flavoprotein (pyridoxamine 5'-phosphate oxidase superfamily)